MALLGNGTSDFLTRDMTGRSLASWSTTFWVRGNAGWSYIDPYFFNRGNHATSSGSDCANALTFSVGATYGDLQINNGGGVYPDEAAAGLVGGTWYFIGWTKTGTTHHVYMGTEGSSSAEITFDGITGGNNPENNILVLFARLRYGTDEENFLPGAMCAVKYWDNQVLSAVEVEAERLYYGPQTAGCDFNWKMNGGTVAACLVDALANGDLTNEGTFSLVAGPSGVEDASPGTAGSIVSTITL